MNRSIKTALIATTALSCVALGTVAANAGAFGLHEQSAYGQGTSFAGVAAGGASLSSMYWNPATMTQHSGLMSESSFSGIMGNFTQTATTSPLIGQTNLGGTGPFAVGTAGNFVDLALVPANYHTWQVTQNLWLGLAINAPWGLTTRFQDPWAGRNYALTSSVLSINGTPSIAWKFNDWISVGAGVQIQYFKADLMRGATVVGPVPPLGIPAGAAISAFPNPEVSGDGWGYGVTAGVTITPTPNTEIGLGWRSAINQKINGTLIVPNAALAGSTPGAISTTINLPDIVSLGFRQRLSPQWIVMGTLEWTNWSRIGTSNVTTASGAPATISGTPVTIPLQYRDGWLASFGAEYQVNPGWALRAGIGYEQSPISDQVRDNLLPDNNRWWASVGTSWQVTNFLTFDLAYSHIFAQAAHIDISAASGNPHFSATSGTYIGDASGGIDILSFAFRLKWDAILPRPVITKG
jgi:long-chain fatty acid transport protein